LLAVKPSTRHSIEKHSSTPRLQDSCDPAAPLVAKTASTKDVIEVSPIDRVKGFSEVKLEYDGRDASLVAALD
jgi:hypothetical protein